MPRCANVTYAHYELFLARIYKSFQWINESERMNELLRQLAVRIGVTPPVEYLAEHEDVMVFDPVVTVEQILIHFKSRYKVWHANQDDRDLIEELTTLIPLEVARN